MKNGTKEKMLKKIFCLVAILHVSDSGSIENPRQIEKRIIDSEDTTIEEFPHQLALLFFGIQWCGAAMISENWAITAGYCVDEVMPAIRSGLSLRVGSTERESGGVIYDLESFVVHEKYDSDTFDYDVAVVKSKQPFEFSAQVQPIPLPVQDQVIQPDTIFTITGWGRLEVTGPFPTVLQKTKTPYVDHELCAEMHSHRLAITDRMFCAGWDRGASFCTGDFGGPLIHNGILYGVASWSRGCGQLGSPGVYLNVAVARSWILEKAGV